MNRTIDKYYNNGKFTAHRIPKFTAHGECKIVSRHSGKNNHLNQKCEWNAHLQTLYNIIMHLRLPRHGAATGSLCRVMNYYTLLNETNMAEITGTCEF